MGGEAAGLGGGEEEGGLVPHLLGGGGDSGHPVGPRALRRLDGEPVAGLEVGALGETAVDDEIAVCLGGGAGGEGVRGQRGGVPGVPVGGPVLVDGSPGCQGFGQEGQFGDDLTYAGHLPELGGEVAREPGPFGDRLGLVFDLGLALLVFDGGLVDVLVGGDHDGRRGIPFGGDRAAQARLQEGAAGGDESGRAHQGEERTEEATFAGSDGPQGVTQHHEGSLPGLSWGAGRFSGAASGAGKARNRVSTVRAPGGVSASGRL